MTPAMPSQERPGHTNVEIAPDRSGRKIRQAMVLAAGLGERMRPLTDDRPKPMLAVAGKPIIDRILDDLIRNGIERVVVNTFYLPDVIEDHLAHRDAPDIGTVIPVVKNADAPVRMKGIHEGHQGTGALRKFEAIKQFAAIAGAGLTG